MQYCPKIRIYTTLFLALFVWSACAEDPVLQTPNSPQSEKASESAHESAPASATHVRKRPSHFTAPFDVSSVINQVRNSVRQDPKAPGKWAVHNTTYSATYTQDSMRFIARNPNARVDASPTPWAVSWKTQEISTGSHIFNTGAPTSTHAKNEFHYTWGNTRETYTHSNRGVEQSWTFQSIPNPGKHDLRIVGSLEGAQLVAHTESGLHFKDASSTHNTMIAYSKATIYDANGKTLHVQPQWDASTQSISITVPASYLAQAQWPVVVDPTFSTENGTDDPATPLAPTTSATSTPTVAYDGTNYMIVWVEDRSPEEGSGVYGTIVQPNGTIDTPTGFGVSVEGALDWGSVDVTSDGANWYVVWTDQRSLGGSFSLRGALIDDTDLDAISTTPILIANGDSNPGLGEARIASDGNGFLAVYSLDETGGVGDGTKQVSLSRINASGVLTDASPVSLANGAGDQKSPTLSGVQGRYAIVWEEGSDVSMRAVVDGALVGSNTSISTNKQDPDVACDRLNISDTDRWFCSLAYSDALGAQVRGLEIGPSSITALGSDTSITAVQPTHISIARVQKLSVVVFETADNITTHSLDGVDDNDTFTVSAGVNVATTADTEILPDVVLGANSGASSAIADQDLIITWLNATDENVEGVIADSLSPGSVTIFNQRANAQDQAAVTFNGTDYVVAWIDQRNGNSDIYATRVQTDGTIRDTSGIAVTTNAGDDERLSLCSNGSDNTLAVWARGNTDVRAQRIANDGTLQGSEITVATAANNVYKTDCDAIPSGNYLAAWGSSNGSNTHAVGTGHITTAGSLSNVQSNIAGTDRVETFATAASTTNFVVSWIDFHGGDVALQAQRFNSDGTTSGVTQDLDSTSSFADTDHTDLIHLGDGNFAATWTLGGDIHLGFVSSDLSTFTPAAAPLESDAATDTLPTLALIDEGHVAVAWQRPISDTNTDILGSEALVNSTDGVTQIGSPFNIANGVLFDQNPAAAGNGVGQVLFAYDRFVAGEGASTLRVRASFGTFNRRPTATTDSYSTNEDEGLSIAAAGVLTNDTDPEGLTLNSILASDVSNGTLTLNSDGSFSYTPTANFSGSDSFSYRARDVESLVSDVTTVNITVDPVNDAPVAAADSYAVDEDDSISISAAAGVLDNDSDIDPGDVLSAILDNDVSNGTLTLNSNGSFDYTPNSDFSGSDSFSYRAQDNSGAGNNQSPPTTVTITVDPINDAPVATGDSYTINEGDTLNVAAASGVLANDTDVDTGDTLTAVALANETNGSATLNANGSFTFTPDADFAGTASFTYRAQDNSGAGNNQSAVTTVTITVNPVNDAPVGGPDTFAATEDTTLTVSAPGVLNNDSDVDTGDVLIAVLEADAGNGSVTLNANGSFSYAPNPNFFGTDSFTYRAQDDSGAGNNQSTPTTVTINVAGTPDNPIANPDTFSVAEDTILTVDAPGILSNDSDPDNESLTVNPIPSQNVSNGVLVLGTDGSFTYTPSLDFSGSDSFTYLVSDGNSPAVSATVTINVTNAQDSPTVSITPNTYNVDEGQTVAITANGSDPDQDDNDLDYDWDLDGDGEFDDAVDTQTINFNAVDGDDGGTSTIVTVRVTDNTNNQVTTTATVNIANVDPTITEARIVPNQDTSESVALDFEATATDPGGANDPLTYTWDFGDDTPTQTGATPTHTYLDAGTFTVTLTVTDDDGGEATQDFSVTINDVPPTLTAISGPITIAEGSPGVWGSTIGKAINDTVSWSIDWGDNTAATTGNLNAAVASGSISESHIYADDGTFTIRISATDDDGETTFREVDVTVTNVAPTITNITNDNNEPEGSSFSFSATATDPGDDPLVFTWNFGDGSPAGNGANVSHIYADDGQYTVTLTVSEGGVQDVETFTVNVLNANPTITDITLPNNACTDSPAADNGCEGDALSFSATATDPGGTNDPLTYTWNFGDGTPTQTGSSPTHTYADNGTFTVTLTVTDDGDGTISEQRTVVIENVRPSQPDFDAPAPSTEGQEVTFTAFSTDPGNDPLTYTWDFGDGSPTQTGSTVIHIFADDDANDRYTVQVTVTDGDGGSNSRSRNVTIRNANPVIEQITGTFFGAEGDELDFSATVTDPAGANDSLTYTWDFGDGSPTISGLNRTNVSHTYTTDGSYTLTLTVDDEDGGSVEQTRGINIGGSQPVIEALTATANINEGDTLTFFGDAEEAGAEAITYRWYFGDPPPNNPCTDPADFQEVFSTPDTPPSEPSYTYTEDSTALPGGFYTITLCATDNDGTAQQSINVTVANVAPSIGTFNVPASGDEAETLNFSATATDPGGANDPLTYTWDFGDGSPIATGASQTHAYDNNGTFTVTLTVEDDEGARTTRTRDVRIDNVNPTITDFVIPSSGEETDTINFSATATDPGADDLVFTWNFGDGTNPQTGTNLSHVYADNRLAGAPYTVTLTVTDGDGGSAQITREITITNKPPTISSLSQPPAGSEGTSFNFIVIASDPAGPADPLNYIWDFGDGSGIQQGGNLDEINHVYTDNGSYEATVTVEDGDGGTTSSTVTVTVNNGPPTIETFTIQPQVNGNPQGPEGSQFRFEAFATDPGGSQDPLTYTWFFGDSSAPVTGPVVSHIYRNNQANDAPYTVRLEVTDDDTGTVSRTQEIIVNNVAPILRVDAAKTDNEGETISFRVAGFDPGVFSDDNGNTPPNPDELTYTWDFGDGSPVETTDAPNATHIYADNGTFTVTVTVEDSDGASDEGTIPVTVRNVNPTIRESNIPIFGFQGTEYTANIIADDPGADTLTYELRNGPEGMTLTENPDSERGGYIVSWTPTAEQAGRTPPVYRVRVRVTDDDNGFDEFTWDISLEFTDDDHDNTPDTCESDSGLDPEDPCDGDGASDDPELSNDENLCDRVPTPAELDIDGDGVSNTQECLRGTRPDVSDAPTVPGISFPRTGDLVDDDTGFLFQVFNSTDPNNDLITYEYELFANDGDCGVAEPTKTDTVASTLGSSTFFTALTGPETEDLVENQFLQWRIRATDGRGFSDWTECARFQYSLVNDPPTIPIPLSPNANDDARTRAEFSLTNATNPDPRPDTSLSYEIEIYDADDQIVLTQVIPEDSSGTTSLRLSSEQALEDNAFYSWRVRAIDGDADDGTQFGAWSDLVDFQVSNDNDPPTTPEIYLPNTNQIFSNTADVFFLTSASNDNDNRPDELTYHFIIQPIADPTSDAPTPCPAVNLQDTASIPGTYIGDIPGQFDNFNPEVGLRLSDLPADAIDNAELIFDNNGALLENTTFSWCIYAYDGRDFSEPAQSRFRFSTVNEPPSLVTIVSPKEGANDRPDTLTVDLIWNAATDPENDPVSYDVEVAFDEAFTDIVFVQSNIPANTTRITTPTLLDDTPYWWRVRAVDPTEAGTWSELGAFFINLANQPPTTPSLLEPTDGLVIEDVTAPLTFSWTRSTDPEGTPVEYVLEVSPSRNGAPLAFTTTIADADDGSGTISFTVDATDNPVFANPDRYNWSVRAVEVGENPSTSDWAPSRFFSVPIPLPGDPPPLPEPEAPKRPAPTETACAVTTPAHSPIPVSGILGLIALAALTIRRRKR